MAVMGDFPVHYFPLNDAPGSTAALDAITGQTATTSMAGVTFTGTSASFDGTGSINLGDNFDFLDGTAGMAMGHGPFTVEAWILPSQPASAGDAGHGIVNLFGEGTVDVGYDVTMPPETGTIAMGLNLGGGSSCGTDPAQYPSETGFYFVGEYDDATANLKVYIRDGNQTDAPPQVGCGGKGASAGMPTVSTLYLASDAEGHNNFTGTISHVAIYPVALSEMQITAHFMAGGTGP